MVKCDILHIIEQHSNWSTQSHVEQDLFGTNVFIIFTLHEDGQEVMSFPGHFLSLRGQHTDAFDVTLEFELFVLRRCRFMTIGLRSDEGVHLQSLFRDEYSDIPFAVVAHLASTGIPHCVMTDMTDWSGLQVLLEAVILRKTVMFIITAVTAVSLFGIQ